VSNTAGSVVNGITSPGYWQYSPLRVDVAPDNNLEKINVSPTATSVQSNITISLYNLDTHGNLTVTKCVYVSTGATMAAALAGLSTATPTVTPGILLTTSGGTPFSTTTYALIPSETEPLTLTLAVPSATFVKAACLITADTGITTSAGPSYVGSWVNVTLPLWVTIRYDIAGSDLYTDTGYGSNPSVSPAMKNIMATPDLKVDQKDISMAAKALNTVPGDPNWNSLADVNGDHKVDGRDEALIASWFGWPSVSSSPSVYINADGSITPSGAPITTSDNITYTFTGDINYPAYNGIVVGRNNIVIDGNGYTVQGNGNVAVYNGTGLNLTDIDNVTIKNANIENFQYGIYLSSSSNNTIYHNNFMNNTSQFYTYNSTNTWDNGYPSGGNYWGDYNGIDLYSGPYQNQTGYDGIGDTPYTIDTNNTDRYPLMQPLSGVGIVEVQTPAGSNVSVSPTENVSVTFASVSAEGSTSWNVVQPSTNQFASVTCNQFRTSANYTGNVTLQFGYDPSGLSLQEQMAEKIWLWNESSSCWVDVTTSVNTTSHVVYGVSPHLSVFGITSCFGITGDLNVPGTTTVSLPTEPPPLPGNLLALNYCNVTTTKNLGPGPYNVSFEYNYTYVQPNEEINVQMWLWNDTSNSWVNITTGVDTANHIVYGLSPHLSVFGITSLPPSGVVVEYADCPKAVVFQGFTACMNFTILNQGNPLTNFDLSLYCNTTTPITFHINQLNTGDSQTFAYNWTTKGYAKGNYSLSVLTHTISWIAVSMVGDLTGMTLFVPDGKCDGRDITIVAGCFGTAAGDPLYNVNCDIFNRGRIDGRDITIVAGNFGNVDP
jgi:hypothetical protein